MSLTEISIKRPLMICTVFIALILFGLISYNGLNYNLLPSFSAGQINIKTTFAGASPQDIETKVTKPIEDAISTVEGIDVVTSSSLQSVSNITIILKSGTNDVSAQQDIERKITQIKATLPSDADDPIVNRYSTDNFAILNLSTSAKTSNSQLYQLIDKKIKPKISSIKGVGQINIIGGEPKEIQVELDNDKLLIYKLSPKQVYQVISANNSSYPAGDIKNENQKLTLSLDANYSQISTLTNLVIKDDGLGSRILLSDVATISEAQKTIATINLNNGKPGIGIQIYKTNDANAVDVSELVKEKLVELKKQYAEVGFDYEIASDQSIYTLASAEAVMHDLFLAILIVGFVMLIFLHSIRSSIFVLIAIPSAMIPTFIAMHIMGFSLNLMTLLALSLVVGILVDDSIVVLENIFRHLEMGKDKRTAALEGRNEIGFTAVGITLVDVVVFLPMAFTGGLIGNILKEFALVVVISTLMSLMVAFTITPMLASRFASLTHLTKATLWGRIILSFESALDGLKVFYGKSLYWILFHKRYLFIIVIGLIVGSIYLIPAGFIGASFLGTSDRGEMSIQLETNSDMPIYQTNLIVQQAEKVVLKHKEVKNVYTIVGTQTGAKGNSSNIAELSVSLVEKTERQLTTDEFGVKIRNEIEKIPGVQVTVIPTGIAGGVNAPIQIVVKGTEKKSVFEVAGIVKDIAQNTAGSDYVRYSTKGAIKQIKVTPNREKITMLGLSLPDVAQSIQFAFSGNNKIELTEGDDNYKINIILNSADKQSANSIGNLALTNNKGELIQLSQVATIEEIIGQSILQRSDRQTSITVTSSAVGRPSGNVVKDIKEKLKQTKLPAGVEISYEGDDKSQTDAFSSLGLALLLAIVLVYMIMVALYESLIHPFIVIFSVPVALIGALLAIALTMNQLTIFTIIGMIMLLGLVTKNGILIVDFAKQLKEEGYSTIDALLEAGKERLRPIIMTTFAMILGMLPLALSHSAGSEFKNGMAWVLIGGLTSSFVLTLFLVPSVYLVVDKLVVHFNKNLETPNNQGKHLNK